MTRRAADRFCAQHLETLELSASAADPLSSKRQLARVKCPVDSSHSVSFSDLQRHVKRCQAAKQVVSSAWFVPDINLVRTEPEQSLAVTAVTRDASITFKEYVKWVAFVEQFYENEIQGTKYNEMPLRQLKYEGLEKRLAELSNKKHAIQQESLISTLGNVGLLLCENCFVEFGAGRGELSRYLNQALLHKYNKEPTYTPSFLLIDRSGGRMKFDSKIIKDSEDLGSKHLIAPIVHRIKTDIKDLDLRKVENNQLQKRSDGKGGIVAISKHLCGAATDLTIQCLMNHRTYRNNSDDSTMHLAGIMIALCCRHQCSYSSYPLEYLAKYGQIDHRGFEILCKMSSWALCGRRLQHRGASDSDKMNIDATGERGDSEDVGYGAKHVDSNNDHNQDHQTHLSRLSISRREEIGFKVRSILDYGRVRNLEDKGFQVELIRYVDKAISSENVCLLALPVQK
ncbi:methyltransferase TRM13-domain-containing protein [Lipomyces chichibuensis]|uniref:methyltransferase TRM13-domain-containing protein n=1 Tax=Lipomyces chichibuensis TaxID=1546026 RepID=UPI0033431FF4